MGKSLKEQVGDALEAAVKDMPGVTVQRNVRVGGSSAKPADTPADGGDRRNSADDRLRLLVERIERLEEEKQGIADDIRDVYAEAKAVGYDAKIMRKVIKLRTMSADDRREQQMILETYANALGIQGVLL